MKEKRKDNTKDKVVSIRMENDLYTTINDYKNNFNAKNIGQTIRFLIEENHQKSSSMDIKLRKFYLLNQINISIERLINKSNKNEVLMKLDEIIALLNMELKNDN